MNSKDVISMSKLKRKSAPSLSAVDQSNDGSDFRGIKDGVKDSGPGLSVQMNGDSLKIIKAHKASSLGHPTVNMEPKVTGEVDLGPTETKSYSPIKTYLKKRK